MTIDKWRVYVDIPERNTTQQKRPQQTPFHRRPIVTYLSSRSYQNAGFCSPIVKNFPKVISPTSQGRSGYHILHLPSTGDVLDRGAHGLAALGTRKCPRCSGIRPRLNPYVDLLNSEMQNPEKSRLRSTQTTFILCVIALHHADKMDFVIVIAWANFVHFSFVAWQYLKLEVYEFYHLSL